VTATLNISAYKFVTLTDAAALRPILLQRATKLQLKGTILLAKEGINLFLAGSDPCVRNFVTQLQADLRFADEARYFYRSHPLAPQQIHRLSPGPARPQGRATRKDRGEFLHRWYPLREGSDFDA
jgi:hypothetical protein